MRYIHQSRFWPQFSWNHEKIASILGPVRNRQGKLIGSMEALGFKLRSEATLKTLTLDVVKSSEIEGVALDPLKVRSSVARLLGMEIGGLVASDRHTDGVVAMMWDATQNYSEPLDPARLFAWHAGLFPTGYSGLRKIVTGSWRDDRHGPMQVVSGSVGRERVHFEAPEATRLDPEMKAFLCWLNAKLPPSGNKGIQLDPVLKAAIAHLWFVTIHPFEDGNGRIARAISDRQLAIADQCRDRFYSMSVQIRKERNAYYDILEKTQKTEAVIRNRIDITPWLEWFLACLDEGVKGTENTLAEVLQRARFWELHAENTLNVRQRLILNKLWDRFEGHLTSSKWAKITKCSQDTALRDITDLIDKGILIKDASGGRSTRYLLNKPPLDSGN